MEVFSIEASEWEGPPPPSLPFMPDMKKIFSVGLISFLIVAGTAQAQGNNTQKPQQSPIQNHPIASYGNACESPYGMCQEEISMREAAHALNMYFQKRGLICRIRMHMGRFVKADIYNGNAFVDSIILDRKTGKMRSIY